jgi:steroid delta-isomerase-like uncharacterized protein
MGKEENSAALGKFAEAVNTGNFDLFREAVAAECVDHDPAPGQGPGPEGYRTFFAAMRKAFPDMAVGVETAVADEESLAFAYTMTGTHQGVLMGIAPTGKKMRIRECRFPSFGMARWWNGGGVRTSLGCFSSWGSRSCLRDRGRA